MQGESRRRSVRERHAGREAGAAACGSKRYEWDEGKMSGRNKTIKTSIEEGRDYLNRCLRLKEPVPDLEEIKDRTICGDTFAVLPLLPEKCVDLLIADPPYNLTKHYHGNTFTKTDAEEYEKYTRKWVEALLPLLKENASVYVCCDWESSLIIGRVLGDYFNIRNRITWQREKGRGCADNWKNGMEDIWYATKSKDFTFHVDAVKQRRKVLASYRVDGAPKDWVETKEGNYRDTCPSNFWDDITIPFWSMPENTDHPTQKPEKLYAKIILASSNEGDLILDPFAGSGTAGVTAKKLKRHFIDVEMNEQYCVWAEQRLAMADKQPGIQGYEDGVFYERNSGPKRRKN